MWNYIKIKIFLSQPFILTSEVSQILAVVQSQSSKSNYFHTTSHLIKIQKNKVKKKS